MAPKVKGVLPVLLSVTGVAIEAEPTARLPKSTELTATEPAVKEPIPLNADVCVPALVGRLNVLDAAPIALGLKLRVYEHEAPAERVDAQLVVEKNGAESVAGLRLSSRLPVLVTVKVLAAEDAPTTTLPKDTFCAERAAPAWTPFPLKLMDLLPAAVVNSNVPGAEPIAVGEKVTLA